VFEVTTLAPMLQLFGILTVLLAVWLFWCDHTNEFAPWLFGASLLMLGIGEVMQ
jgi:hypothetical protein